MTLIWAVPVVAALVAACIVVASGRALEANAAMLALEVLRLREVRRPLRDVRVALDAVDASAHDLGARHFRADGPPPAGDAGGRS